MTITTDGWRPVLTVALLVLLLSVGCNPAAPPEGKDEHQGAGTSNAALPAGDAASIVDRMIVAHGGIDAWRRMSDVHFRETRIRFARQGESRATSVRDLYLKRRNGGYLVRIDLAPGGTLEQLGPDGFPGGEEVVVRSPMSLGYDGREYWETRDGRRVTDPEILKSTRFVVAAWRYWFTLPFALEDPGVNLSYGGEGMVDDRPVHLIDVTFGTHVGDNPDDRFRYSINRESYMVENVRYWMRGRQRFREFRMRDYLRVGDFLHDTRRLYYNEQGVHDGLKEMEILGINLGLTDEIFSAPRSATAAAR